MKKIPGERGARPRQTARKSAPIMLLIGIVFIAATLRAPLTSVGPLIELIRGSLHISDTLAGMITTLPLFAFALFSPFAPALARRFGTETVLLWATVFLTAGILLRSLSGCAGLFIGTAVLGLAISLGNVLIPSLIKREFPERIGLMMGVYTVSMNTFGSAASGVSVPLASGLGLGWAGALGVWAVLSAAAVVVWLPQAKRGRREPAGKKAADPVLPASGDRVRLWKSPLAWQVTLYMGMQSLMFYCMVAWLPEILIREGLDTGSAGWMLSLMLLSQIPVTFVVSVLAGRKAGGQRSLAAFGALCSLVGFLGLLFGGAGFAFLWVILIGVGGAFNFSLAMMFFSLRTANADEAAGLSGMAQSVGYLLAAFGPMYIGALHDESGDWTIPLILLTAASALCLLFGLGASRDRYVGAPPKS